MSKRILITSTDVMMLQFLVPHVFFLKENGYEVEVACSNVENHVDELKTIFEGKVPLHIVDLVRSPLNLKNFKGLAELRSIIKDGNFDLVWTNEPVMGVMTRLAAKKYRKQGLKIIYIAHGFHFYKGAPKKNWLIFYPIEKLLSNITDEIITINQEDYELAQKRFKKTKIIKFNGIGINTKKFQKSFTEEEIQEKRKEIGVGLDQRLIISVGELEKRKNHKSSIIAFSKTKRKDSILIICGVGTQREALEKLIHNLNLEKRVKLLGYRYDISLLCHSSDVFLFTTFQEGLSVALMEAMSVGMRCIISKIRGNVDLIEENRGIYCDPCDIDSITTALDINEDSNVISKETIEYNKKKLEAFDISVIRENLLTEINNLIG